MSESKFKWSPEYSVGVKLLDYDHQELFETVDELHRAIVEKRETEVINPIVDRLSKYAMEHFQREEHIMSEYGFPEISEHRRHHHDFARMTYAVRHLLANDPGKVSYKRLLRFLERWLTHHILGEDMKYRNYLRGEYGRRSTDMTEPLPQIPPDTVDNPDDKRKETEWVAVTVHVPVQSKLVIRRCARLLQLGGEKAELIEELTDPVGAISDDEAYEIAKIVLRPQHKH